MKFLRRLLLIVRAAFCLPAVMLLGAKPIDEISVPELLSYARSRTPRAMLGNVLFPAKDISSLTYKYVIGANNLPVAAKVVAFNQEASIHSREAVGKVTGGIVPIKRKISLDEETMFKLYSPRPGTGEFDEAVADIYADTERMIEAVETRIEALRWEAICTGRIMLNEDGIIQQVDFGFNAATQSVVLAGAALWSAFATATPITDIQNWVDSVVNRGCPRPERAVTSNQVVANLLQCAQVGAMVYGTLGAGQAVTIDQVNGLLARMNLPRIATYDDQYRVQVEAGTYTTLRYLPANLFILLPGQKLGDQLYAPTVEALRKVRQGVINSGDAKRIYCEVWEENEPPAHWTKAAALSFPTFPMVDSIYVAQVIV